MRIFCPECKNAFELKKEYDGADILTCCPYCETYLMIDVKVRNVIISKEEVKTE